MVVRVRTLLFPVGCIEFSGCKIMPGERLPKVNAISLISTRSQQHQKLGVELIIIYRSSMSNNFLDERELEASTDVWSKLSPVDLTTSTCEANWVNKQIPVIVRFLPSRNFENCATVNTILLPLLIELLPWRTTKCIHSELMFVSSRRHWDLDDVFAWRNGQLIWSKSQGSNNSTSRSKCSSKFIYYINTIFQSYISLLQACHFHWISKRMHKWWDHLRVAWWLIGSFYLSVKQVWPSEWVQSSSVWHFVVCERINKVYPWAHT